MAALLPHSLFDPALAFAPRGDGTRMVPLTVIAGPCLLEAPEINRAIGESLRDTCLELGMAFVFKASFDKANRSSVASPRGPGVEAGCDALARLRDELGVPVTTDIHEPSQAARAARSVDILQIPAFLSRQTDLLAAAGATGKPVNIKKGQFMAPSEMIGAIGKLRESGARQIMLTERGSFFGYHRLVNDFIGLGDLMDLGCPVCFDVTHSTQLPGAEGTGSGGRPERAGLLGNAAVAAGVDALFFECHPDPSRASSDRTTSLPLSSVRELLNRWKLIRTALEN
ncbi:MAG: 3-deoxy-8-phosphooctulonate synthase [Planctomycetota bacterium]|nr:3-deoxy-8-phosphooctulonate synthase [Planctomycetota bacterium]